MAWQTRSSLKSADLYRRNLDIDWLDLKRALESVGLCRSKLECLDSERLPRGMATPVDAVDEKFSQHITTAILEASYEHRAVLVVRPRAGTMLF